jgi:hypothetical protein
MSQTRSLCIAWDDRLTARLAGWKMRDCGGPVDRESVAEVIRRLYASDGRRLPAAIVWCGSPLSVTLTRSIVQHHGRGLDVGHVVRTRVRNAVEATVGPRATSMIADSVMRSVEQSLGVRPGAPIGIEFRQTWGRRDIEIGWTLWQRTLEHCDPGSRWRQTWSTIRAGFDAFLGPELRRHGPLPASTIWSDSLYDQQRMVRGALEWLLAEMLDFVPPPSGRLAALRALKDTGAFVLPHEKLCWVAPGPIALATDDRGRPHSVTGPAVAFADGWTIHAVHGVRVPEFVVEHPERIGVRDIEDEPNAESRRVMIDRYRLGEPISGAAAFLRDAGSARLDHDEACGTLWRRDLSGDEPLVMLEVVNSTREPDGSFRHYFLRVPPTMMRARDAAAWTFGLTADQYRPQIET